MKLVVVVAKSACSACSTCRLPARTVSANIPRVLASASSSNCINGTASVTPATATATASTPVLDNWLFATSDSVAHLPAVAALDPGVVPRLGTVLGKMTKLVAVPALRLLGVARLVAVLGHMLDRVTIAASSRGDIGTVLGEMAGFVALAALDALSRTRLRTLLGVMALLVTVPALMRIEACLCAVASTMSSLLAIDTGNLGLMTWALRLLLFAVLANMAKFTAVPTERDTAVLHEASRSEAANILLWGLGPTLSHLCATRLGRKLDGKDEFTIRIANEVDNGHVCSDLLGLGNEMNTQAIIAKRLLDVWQTKLIYRGASIGPQTGPKRIKVFHNRSFDK